MSRWGLRVLGGVMAAMAVSGGAWAQEMKIGYVNLAKVFDGYEKTKANDATLTKKGQQKEAELQARVQELEKLRKDLELTNPDAREGKIRQIEEKADALKRFRTSTARELQKERNSVAQGILQEIQGIVNEYAKANNYSLILDERSLLYGQTANDVTDEVLQLLNSKAAKR